MQQSILINQECAMKLLENPTNNSERLSHLKPNGGSVGRRELFYRLLIPLSQTTWPHTPQPANVLQVSTEHRLSCFHRVSFTQDVQLYHQECRGSLMQLRHHNLKGSPYFLHEELSVLRLPPTIQHVIWMTNTLKVSSMGFCFEYVFKPLMSGKNCAESSFQASRLYLSCRRFVFNISSWLPASRLCGPFSRSYLAKRDTPHNSPHQQNTFETPPRLSLQVRLL